MTNGFLIRHTYPGIMAFGLLPDSAIGLLSIAAPCRLRRMTRSMRPLLRHAAVCVDVCPDSPTDQHDTIADLVLPHQFNGLIDPGHGHHFNAGGNLMLPGKGEHLPHGGTVANK